MSANRTENEPTSDPKMEVSMTDEEMVAAATAAQVWVMTAGVTGGNQ